ncbi:protein of unknown function (plasmid) [Paraburkholderia kururiensis]
MHRACGTLQPKCAIKDLRGGYTTPQINALVCSPFAVTVSRSISVYTGPAGKGVSATQYDDAGSRMGRRTGCE